MEKEITEIILKKMYSNLITTLYKNGETKYDFPPVLDVDKIPFNVVYDFCTIYFNKYKTILIKNGFIYAVRIKDNKFTNYFIDNINNLEEALYNEELFKTKMTEYAIKHIVNKTLHTKIDDSEIIKKYTNILEKIEKINLKISTLSNIYRDIITNFSRIKTPYNIETIYEQIIFTDIYDKELLNHYDILNKDNINDFKKTVISLILNDTYIFLEVMKEEEEDYEYKPKNKTLFYDEDTNFEDEDDEYFDEDEEYEREIEEDEEISKDINQKILDYINNCIQNKKIVLPNNVEMRYNMYAIFDAYNMNEQEKNFYKENLSIEKRLELKKINPYYMLDFM